MGAKVSRDEVLFTIQRSPKQKWVYSSKYPPHRVILQEESAEWLGWFSQPLIVDMELENGIANDHVLFRLTIFTKCKDIWKKRGDKIFNLQGGDSFRIDKWKLDDPGKHKMCFEVHVRKKLVLRETVSFIVTGLMN